MVTVSTFGHHGHWDIMNIWISWTFGHHGYLDIMDIWISWIFGYGWIFGYPGYLDIMNIWISWQKAIPLQRPGRHFGVILFKLATELAI